MLYRVGRITLTDVYDEYTKKLINNGVLIYDSFTYFYRLNRDDDLLENILKKLKLNRFGSILINQVRDDIEKIEQYLLLGIRFQNIVILCLN